MKKIEPKVSIIMNCYNGEKFLKYALTSVIKQTYKNWELIFLDNQSTDASKKIFLSFSDKRFKYFLNKKKTTLYKARNLAISYSRGKYISFLDVDDMWNKDKLKIQLNRLKETNSQFVFSNYKILKKKAKVAFFFKKPEGFIYNKLSKHYFIPILTVLFNKEIIKKKKFDTDFNIIGDFDLFFKLSFFHKFSYVHQPLATYRIHSENFSLKHNSLYLREYQKWLTKNKNNYSKVVIKNIFLLKEFLKIKILIFNSRYKKAIIEIFKYPFSLKKIKLFFMLLLPKKNFNF